WHGCFFFSSRRRHTRWPRDWSSDVCSSDLSTIAEVFPERARGLHPDFQSATLTHLLTHRAGLPHDGPWWELARRGSTTEQRKVRSEERRVGKEGRSQWSRDHEKKEVKSETH